MCIQCERASTRLDNKKKMERLKNVNWRKLDANINTDTFIKACLRHGGHS